MAKQLNCWVAEDLAEQVEAAAAQEDRSVSSWLRRLIMSELTSRGDTGGDVDAEAAA